MIGAHLSFLVPFISLRRARCIWQVAITSLEVCVWRRLFLGNLSFGALSIQYLGGTVLYACVRILYSPGMAYLTFDKGGGRYFITLN
jgi:hypothetical protein